MSDAPTLPLLSLRLIRQNAVDFIAQTNSTTELMPMLPTRIISICDTAIAALDAVEAAEKRALHETHLHPSLPGD